MAYVTGSAADMAAVKTALVNACTANGWTEQTDGNGKTVLIQDDSSLADPIYVRVESTTDEDGNPALALLGRTSLDAGDAPGVVKIMTIKGEAVVFPVTYFAFVFISEVYFIINYSDKYQWCAFGQSQQNGLPGTGNWISAIGGSRVPNDGINISSGGGGGGFGDFVTAAAPFWAHDYDYPKATRMNTWLHNDFEASYPWALGQGGNQESPIGIKYLEELLDAQPNQFSGEGVLLPIRGYKSRPNSKVSQLVELEYARHIRIDNYSSEQVITLGTDEWMVFPYYKKDAANRNGGSGVNHTGTFGWAIKKA